MFNHFCCCFSYPLTPYSDKSVQYFNSDVQYSMFSDFRHSHAIQLRMHRPIDTNVEWFRFEISMAQKFEMYINFLGLL